METIGLPGIERPLDNTALQAYMACPREYFMSMVLHRRGSGGRSPALAYGGLMHKFLEMHYKGIPVDMNRIIGEKWWEENGHNDESDYRSFDRCWLDFRRYREKYGENPEKEDARTIGYPDEPLVEVSSDSMGGGLLHPYAGKKDRFIDNSGLVFIEDHKTTSRLDRHYFSGFELSQQMMGYTFLGQQLAPSLKIQGVRINVIHVTKTATAFERQIFTWTREQLAEWVTNTNYWMQRISDDSVRWIEAYGRGGMPEANAIWPVGHLGDNGCSRKFGMCQFHPVCRVSTALRHKFLAQIEVNPWNPLEIED